MLDVIFPHAAFLLAITISEVVLKGTKVQTGLKRVLFVFSLIGLTTLLYLVNTYGHGIPVFLIYWTGAFLTWFGVRSHIESSILLRILFFLKERPLTQQNLINRYTSYYGAHHRVEELCRAGLIQSVPEGFRLTPKGKFILRVTTLLR